MARNRGRFTDEFRESVAREVVEKSRPIVDVAKRHGVSTNSVSRWVKDYRDRYDDPIPDSSAVSDNARIRELEKQLRVLREENEILGKAAAFFAKKHR